jgi:hypothetical protein
VSQRIVTHYARRTPRDGVWQLVSFVTRQPGILDRFFFGFDTSRDLTVEDIASRVQSGLLCQVTRSRAIAENERLWLSPEGDIWLSNHIDPYRYKSKRLLDAGSLRREREQRQISAVEQSAVMSSIVAKKTLEYLWGDYLNSQTAPFQSYCPEWQRQFIHNVLVTTVGLLPDSIALKEAGRQEHRYGHVAKLIRNHTISLALEFILRDEERASDNIDIIQLGNITHYALVFPRGNHVRALLPGSVEHGERWTANDPWHAFLVDSPSALVCGHAGTAADHALEDLISAKLMNDDRKTERERTTELVDWLKHNKKNGVVVCDVGIVSQLGARDPSMVLEYILVPYAAAIPTGLAYDGQDARWGNILLGALNDVATSSDEVIQASLRDSARRLEQLGGEWTFQIGTSEDVDDVSVNVSNQSGASSL